MHSTTSSSPFSGSSVERSTRVAPPGPIVRWTGRAVLTIPLPSLASLRLAHATEGRASGFGAARELAARA